MEGRLDLNSYHTVKQIGAGGFGVVDEGVGPDGGSVAIKKELAYKVTRPTLEHEYNVYKILAGHHSIPDVKICGRQHKHNIMVMDLLGPSLGDRFRHCDKRFSLGTIACLGLRMLDAIEYIHSRGFIHRDIKPQNFVLGLGAKSHMVYLIDFGLARRWRSVTTSAHASSASGGNFVLGTLDFTSVNTHIGLEQTRRDDLHALTYTMLQFARGGLPWDNIRRETRKHCERRILEKKRSWTAARLCQDLPHEFEEFSSHCFSLEFNEEPRYDLLRDKLAIIANQEGGGVDAKFEWEEPDWTEVPHAPKSQAPSVDQVPPSCVKRGDVVLLKLLPEESLDYEAPPRLLDPSFLPHRPPPMVERYLPYRPAVVYNVVTEENDPMYLTLEVYPFTRRSSLSGLSTRRKRVFLQVEMLTETATGIQIPCSNIFLYETSLSSRFKIKCDQMPHKTPPLSLPESILGSFEDQLVKVPNYLYLTYSSDDEETRHIHSRLPRGWSTTYYVMDMQLCDTADLAGGTPADFNSINGWISEMMPVESVRRMENGELSHPEYSVPDGDSDFFNSQKARDRRLSCTLALDTLPTQQYGTPIEMLGICRILYHFELAFGLNLHVAEDTS